MGKRQRRREREQPQQDTTPAVTVQARLATAESSVPGQENDED